MATRLALSFLALTAVSRGQASLPGDLPSCVTTCYNAKLSEASWLVPGVGNTDLAALCASGTFVQAFQTCLSDNCNDQDSSTGQSLFSQVCSAQATATSIAGEASSTLSDLASSASSAFAEATSEASSILATAITATEVGALSSASAEVLSSLESVSSRLSDELASRSSEIASEVSSQVASATSFSSSSGTSSSPTATGTTGASGENQGDGDNSAPALHPGAIVGMLATALAAGLGIGALA
ncbi:CFEM domain-containing protein [Rhodotorula paludigena]|uniref:CFEM domain-containing protein n=1 Tax=Rhodotorula paludigena TaxID=86838 RepID=UPI0031757BFA